MRMRIHKINCAATADLSDDPVPIIGISQHVHTYSETLLYCIRTIASTAHPYNIIILNFVKLPC